MANDEHGPMQDPGSSEDIREMLADLPSPAIPPYVSERILDAIAAESESRGTDQQSNVHEIRRSSRTRRLLPVAVSAAAIVLFALMVWPLADKGDPPGTVAAGTGCTVSADAATDISPVLHASGVQYTKASLTSQAESVIEHSAVRCGQAGQTEVTFDGGPSGGAGTGPEHSPIPGDPLHAMPLPESEESVADSPQTADGQEQPASDVPRQLPDEAIVRKCVVAVAEDRPLHSVDVATFDGKPAVVVVLGSPLEVMALRCGTGDPRVLAQRSMARKP